MGISLADIKADFERHIKVIAGRPRVEDEWRGFRAGFLAALTRQGVEYSDTEELPIGEPNEID